MNPVTNIADARTMRYASLNSTPGKKSSVLLHRDSQKTENGLLAAETSGQIFQNTQNSATSPKNQRRKLSA